MSTSDLAEFLDSLGVEDIVDHGEEVGARCFMHAERTGYPEDNPRHWFINRRTHRHHCFSCGYKGSIQTLVLDICGSDAWKAAGLLQNYLMDHLVDGLVEAPEPEQEFSPIPQVRLLQYPWPPDRALEKRGISLASCKLFGVRWDESERCWVLPVREPSDPFELWGWQEKHADHVKNRPYRIPKKKTLFGIEVLPVGEPVVLVESPLDVLVCWDAGYNAVSSFGAEVSDEQMRLLCRYTPTLILALDNDDAGTQSTQRLAGSWGTRFTDALLLFNYSHVPDDCKDVGEMENIDIEYGVERALHIFESDGIHRHTKRLPGRSGRPHDRAQSTAGRLPAGPRKNRALHSRNRKTHRGR